MSGKSTKVAGVMKPAQSGATNGRKDKTSAFDQKARITGVKRSSSEVEDENVAPMPEATAAGNKKPNLGPAKRVPAPNVPEPPKLPIDSMDEDAAEDAFGASGAASSAAAAVPAKKPVAPPVVGPGQKKTLARSSSVSSMSSVSSRSGAGASSSGSSLGGRSTSNMRQGGVARATASTSAYAASKAGAGASTAKDPIAEVGLKDGRVRQGVFEPAKAGAAVMSRGMAYKPQGAGAGASFSGTGSSMAAALQAATIAEGVIKKEIIHRKMDQKALERALITLTKKNALLQCVVIPQLQTVLKDNPGLLDEIMGKLKLDKDLLELGNTKGSSATTSAATKAAAARLGETIEQLGKVTQEVNALRLERSDLTGHVKRLGGEVESLKAKYASASAEATASACELEGAKAKIAALQQALDKQREKHGKESANAVKDAERAVEDRLGGEIARLSEQLKARQEAVSKAQAELASKEAQLEQAQAALETRVTELTSTQARVSQLEGQLREAQDKAGELQGQVEALEEELDSKQDEIADLHEQQQDLCNDNEKLMAALESAEGNFHAQLHDKDASAADLQVKLVAAQTAEASLVAELDKVKAAASSTSAASAARIAQLELSLAAAAAHTASLEAQAQAASSAHAAELAQAQAEIGRYADKYEALEAKRAALLEQVLTLKGAIRVIARVRPALPQELAGGTAGSSGASAKAGKSGKAGASIVPEGDPLFVFPDGSDEATALEVHERPGAGVGGYGQATVGKKSSFAFNRVLPPTADNGDVFSEVEGLVESALNGSRVCIFAYGQTGSGKTYTMQGGSEDPGLIPRSLDHLFARIAFLAERGWTVSMSASMLEIYNESIRDLLAGSSSGAGASSSSSKAELPLVALKDGSGFEVKGLSSHAVAGPEDVQGLLEAAASARATSATAMNSQSSRSHAVFSLHIKAVNTAQGGAVHRNGTLHLVDLAGSERLDKSGAEGEAKKETAAINSSLSHLASVIRGLQAGDKHIPYRNSKLTQVLQSSLGGSNCKTLLVAALNPLHANASESLSTLRFAEGVAKVETK